MFACPFASEGVDPISHKKKALFWRKLAGSFPQLVDFFANPADLGQVYPSFVASRRHIPFYAAPRKLPNPPWEFLNARNLFITPSGILQTELVVGLDGFYRSYIASEVDTCTREEDDAAFPAVLFSSVRFEYRAAVSLSPPASHGILEIWS